MTELACLQPSVETDGNDIVSVHCRSIYRTELGGEKIAAGYALAMTAFRQSVLVI
jgi:hypothetical protein